jgi:hypothetical protein
MLNNVVGLFSTVGGAANSYESISTVSLTTGTAFAEFTSIPATYKHLQVRGIIMNAASASNVAIRVGNGSVDTGSNYASHQLQGDGSAASAAGSSSASIMQLSGVCQATSLYPFAFIYDFFDYASTNKYKTVRGLSGQDGNASGTATDWRVQLTSGLWMNSASAINTIRIYLPPGNMGNYSSFALYGIKG